MSNLTTGQINDRLPFLITGKLISELGIEPVAKEKKASFYSEDQYVLFLRRLAARLEKLADEAVQPNADLF